MLEVWARNIQVTATDVIDSLVVDQERAVRVFNCAVGRQDRVVRLHNRSRDTWSGVDGKFELGLLSVLGRETFQEKRTEARASTATE